MSRYLCSGLTFDCQHGPVECEGNMYHACAAAHIREKRLAVEMAACMIRDNMDPEAAARTCAQQLRYECNQAKSFCLP